MNDYDITKRCKTFQKEPGSSIMIKKTLSLIYRI